MSSRGIRWSAAIVAGWLTLGVLAAGVFEATDRGMMGCLDARMTRQNAGVNLALGLLTEPSAFLGSMVYSGLFTYGIDNPLDRSYWVPGEECSR